MWTCYVNWVIVIYYPTWQFYLKIWWNLTESNYVTSVLIYVFSSYYPEIQSYCNGIGLSGNSMMLNKCIKVTALTPVETSYIVNLVILMGYARYPYRIRLCILHYLKPICCGEDSNIPTALSINVERWL